MKKLFLLLLSLSGLALVPACRNGSCNTCEKTCETTCERSCEDADVVYVDGTKEYYEPIEGTTRKTKATKRTMPAKKTTRVIKKTPATAA